ncbi:MAG: nucleoside triphosphate pyrophosphohydrolase [Ruminococcaceae bacterium]|nr:nucleoside triphosphate pyrophosphohydrolase [Oscillospiraceae bacterium]
MILGKNAYNIDDLVSIVELLRLPGGCPWDMEQTHKSLRKDLIEETYEVIEAIDNDDPVLLREELGDALLQIVMHARIEEEAGRATFDEIAGDVCRKMIHRHPHVFGQGKADSVAEVLSNWEKIKSEEKSRNTVTDKLNAIPRQLPALMRAAKIGKKATVLDFPSVESVLSKVREELGEIEAALAEQNADQVLEEVGDLLFTAASLARLVNVEPEEALTRATDKFVSRFAAVEENAIALGQNLADMSDEEKNKLWENVKKMKICENFR